MDQRKRLIELIEQRIYNKTWTFSGLVDYLLASGIVVPPCKVMQTVYYISFGKVYKGICHAITIHDGGIQVHLYDFDGDNASYSSKDVFLTREEAERELERRKQ